MESTPSPLTLSIVFLRVCKRKMIKKVGLMPTEVFWGNEFCFSLDNNEENTTKNNLLVEINLQCFSVELSPFKKHLQQVCFVVPEDHRGPDRQRESVCISSHILFPRNVKKNGLNWIPLVQLTGCEVEGNSRPSLRVSLAGHSEVFHSFTLSSLFGVSVEHVALASVTRKVLPS